MAFVVLQDHLPRREFDDDTILGTRRITCNPAAPTRLDRLTGARGPSGDVAKFAGTHNRAAQVFGNALKLGRRQYAIRLDADLVTVRA